MKKKEKLFLISLPKALLIIVYISFKYSFAHKLTHKHMQYIERACFHIGIFISRFLNEAFCPCVEKCFKNIFNGALYFLIWECLVYFLFKKAFLYYNYLSF